MMNNSYKEKFSMSKANFNKVLGFGLIVGGVILELGIIKKLDDIHEEIKYLEQEQGIYACKKRNDEILKEQYEQIRKEGEED